VDNSPCHGSIHGVVSSTLCCLANEGKSSRERLTLIRIFEQLRELGYEGSYDAVRRYAKKWRAERGAAASSAMPR